AFVRLVGVFVAYTALLRWVGCWLRLCGGEFGFVDYCFFVCGGIEDGGGEGEFGDSDEDGGDEEVAGVDGRGFVEADVFAMHEAEIGRAHVNSSHVAISYAV